MAVICKQVYEKYVHVNALYTALPTTFIDEPGPNQQEGEPRRFDNSGKHYLCQ